jgi:hypothetical protein
MTDQPRFGSRRGRPWDDDSIRDTLTEFLKGKTRWPTYDEFIDAGLKGMRDVLPRFGGPERWSQEMGLQDGPRRWGGVVRWTDDAIRSALTQFLDGRTLWPTHREFRRAGLGGLYSKLLQEGTLEMWASEIGIPPPTPMRQAPRPRRPVPKAKPAQPAVRHQRLWTDERIAKELSAFIGEREEWPPYSEFIATAGKRLYQAVLNHGGTRYWAQSMRVRWVDRRGVPHWTEQHVRERLSLVLGGRENWPTPAEFAAVGEQRLLAAVRRHGGIPYWAKEFDVALPPRPAGSLNDGQAQRMWTDERIAESIAPLIAELGRWPTKGEFRKAGLGGALGAVYDHGGSASWQRRFGVEPPPFHGPIPNRSRWDDQQIEATLRAFCRDRVRWPTLEEFDAAGLTPLYRAAGRRHGVAWWRERLGLL